MILSGVTVILQVPTSLAIVIIVLLGIVGKSDAAMSTILVNRYLGNFANKEIVSKIYAASSIVKNLIRMIIGMAGSVLLGITTSSNAMVIGGIVFFIVSIILLIYMKPRVGLKPEQYSKQEIGVEI